MFGDALHSNLDAYHIIMIIYHHPIKRSKMAIILKLASRAAANQEHPLFDHHNCHPQHERIRMKRSADENVLKISPVITVL